MVTVPSFRESFPEITVAITPDTRVQYWIDKSANYFNVERWGGLLDTGVGYWVAHNLSMDALASQTPLGGSPVVAGPLSSQTAHDVSVSFHAPSGHNQGGASPLNGTYQKSVYGMRYLEALDLIKVGVLVP